MRRWIYALFAAADDNYLYMLLEAGPQPAGKWELDFFMDFDEMPAGPVSVRLVWSDQVGAFTVASVDGCSDSAAQTYPALFAWGMFWAAYCWCTSTIRAIRARFR